MYVHRHGCWQEWSNHVSAPARVLKKLINKKKETHQNIDTTNLKLFLLWSHLCFNIETTGWSVEIFLRFRDIGFSDFVHCPDFSLITMKKHNVSETGSVSILR
jgi:hypothetical protein